MIPTNQRVQAAATMTECAHQSCWSCMRQAIRGATADSLEHRWQIGLPTAGWLCETIHSQRGMLHWNERGSLLRTLPEKLFVHGGARSTCQQHYESVSSCPMRGAACIDLPAPCRCVDSPPTKPSTRHPVLHVPAPPYQILSLALHGEICKCQAAAVHMSARLMACIQRTTRLSVGLACSA